ncbi:unnamed protein product, partial [Prorocentrum cordatum]
DDLGCTPALAVVTEALLREGGGAVCTAVEHFLRGGPGVRAALLPEEAVAVLRASGLAVAAHPKLRFPKEYDLFRLVDLPRRLGGPVPPQGPQHRWGLCCRGGRQRRCVAAGWAEQLRPGGRALLRRPLPR